MYHWFIGRRDGRYSICGMLKDSPFGRAWRLTERLAQRKVRTKANKILNLIGPPVSEKFLDAHFSQATVNQFLHGFPQEWEEVLDHDENSPGMRRGKDRTLSAELAESELVDLPPRRVVLPNRFTDVPELAETSPPPRAAPKPPAKVSKTPPVTKKRKFDDLYIPAYSAPAKKQKVVEPADDDRLAEVRDIVKRYVVARLRGFPIFDFQGSLESFLRSTDLQMADIFILFSLHGKRHPVIIQNIRERFNADIKKFKFETVEMRRRIYHCASDQAYIATRQDTPSPAHKILNGTRLVVRRRGMHQLLSHFLSSVRRA